MPKDQQKGILARFWALLTETLGDTAGPARPVALRPAQAVIAAAAQQLSRLDPRPVAALPPLAALAIKQVTEAAEAPTAPAEPARATSFRHLAARIRAQALLNIPASRSHMVALRAARTAERTVAKKKIVKRHVWLESRKAPVSAVKPQLRLVADNTRRTETRIQRAA